MRIDGPSRNDRERADDDRHLEAPLDAFGPVHADSFDVEVSPPAFAAHGWRAVLQKDVCAGLSDRGY
jgi:hypothetical protein